MDVHTSHRIAILGNHIPRQCGIATFTADLAKHLDAEVHVIAMNDRSGYRYPDVVSKTIEAEKLADYQQAADWLNAERMEVLSVQHEFGIYGGECGEYLLELLRNVKMPIVTTLHTILREPTDCQRRVFEELIQLSERVVVMSQTGADMLGKVYGLSSRRIDVVPHGIHAIPAGVGARIRAEMGIGDRPLILTFGLLAYDKGVHDMIQAMADVVAVHPDAVYVVVGATHPHIRQREGEAYRERLYEEVRRLGIEDNVYFVNKFVSDEELKGWLDACDIYVTPYLKPEQITSGTLAYAVGAGCAVVSTPYWHASEILSEGRGVLVPFREPAALAEAVSGLVANPDIRYRIQQRAFDYGRTMLWGCAGAAYLKIFERARHEGAEHLRNITTQSGSELSLRHLSAISDDVGVFQHAVYEWPNRHEGYCTDDCARALEFLLTQEPTALLDRCFEFVWHAYDPERKRFRNFMGFDRKWIDEGSDDCQGRTFHALCQICRRRPESSMADAARTLVADFLPTVMGLKSPRAWSWAAMGLADLCKQESNSEYREKLEQIVGRLMQLYTKNGTCDWPWFEPTLAYDNARLSQALILSGQVLSNREALRMGLESLGWLTKVQTAKDGCFAPIGCKGFYTKGGVRAWFDQQPVDVWASVSACVSAWRATGDIVWWDEAHRAFDWFMGENTEQLVMADSEEGRCFDGLEPGRVNRNCGAESTLAFLASCWEMNSATTPPRNTTAKLEEG